MTWPTEQAREAVQHMSCVWIDCPGPHDPRHGPDGPRIARKKADRILAALAPHVAALVRAERAAASAAALEGVMHEVYDIEDAELIARRADQWRAEAEEGCTHPSTRVVEDGPGLAGGFLIRVCDDCGQDVEVVR